MSCNLMSCNFMPCNFDDPSFSCLSLSAPHISLVHSIDPACRWLGVQFTTQSAGIKQLISACAAGAAVANDTDWTGRHSGGSRNFRKNGAEDNVSASSSFMANVNNELYAFYTEKCGLFKNKFGSVGESGLPRPPWIRHWGHTAA